MLPRVVEAVGAQFEITGQWVDAAPLGSGHIHQTLVARYRVGERVDRYVFQRINTRVFTDPAALMDNWVRICEHLRAVIEREGLPGPGRRCPQLLRTRDGQPYCVAPDGVLWRAFPFIEGTRSVDTVHSETEAHEAGRAFGAFLARLQGFPDPPPTVTIAHFHDLPHRFAALERAVEADSQGRGAGVEREVELARSIYERLAAALAAAGELPTRIVHNDCKINNVLLDVETGEGLCVIDLDTVMEGTVLADFGELVRTSGSRHPEDEVDVATMSLELPWIRAVARGFIEGSGRALVAAELAALPLAAPLMAYENAIRFLTDHLEGDTYFRVHRPAHNLDRFRAQLRLAELFDAAAGEVADAVASASG